MKWVQLKDVLDSDGVKIKSEREELFKEYEAEEELLADLNNPDKFEEWVTYPNDQFQKTFSLSRKAQRKYELFCGGFLHYHDFVFKQYQEGAGYEYPKTPGPGITPTWKDYAGDKTFEHEIYFEWFPKEKKTNKKTSVKIHITPTPPKFNAKPPPPPTPPPPESNE